ncbi:MAG: acyl-CoA dehydrogenase family protein [bacterium]
MAFAFTQDQDSFRQVVKRFCAEKAPTPATRKLMDTESGYDPEVWQLICGELGLAGIHLPEHAGGSGFGAVELGIVMEEFGRSLICAPYMGSIVMAASALAACATASQQQRWLAPLLSGEKIGALAICEDSADFYPTHLHCTARIASQGWQISGRKRFVLNGRQADTLIVAAATDNGPRLFVLEADAPGVLAKQVVTMDSTRKMAELTFNNSDAELLGQDVPVNLDALQDLTLVALVNEMAGGAQALLDAAVQYTKLRVQFGRTIGSFQAIKHRLADLLLVVENAKSAAYQAAAAFDNNDSVSEHASLAKAAASEAYLQAAIDCIQLHGGIGFTWENDTHLWFKRAKSSEVFMGTPAFHRERMLQAMGV